MRTIKLPPNRWLDNILLALRNFSDPSQGVIDYEFGHMYRYYSNYIDFAGMQLEDFLFYEFLDEGYAIKYGLPENLVLRLKKLRILVDQLFNVSIKDKLSDFEVIRRKEWDDIMPLAKGCYEDLCKVREKMPKDED